jgi:hypothetical protein
MVAVSAHLFPTISHFQFGIQEDKTMTTRRIRIFRAIAIATFAVLVATTTYGQMSQEGLPGSGRETSKAMNGHGAPCAIRTIAGAWMFATDIGISPGGVRMTAIGTYNIGADGSLRGTFDYNGTDGFYSGVTYTGTVTVHRDCTGTVIFTTSGGASVTQSIVIVRGGQEIWGAFQDPTTVWSYRANRISGGD